MYKARILVASGTEPRVLSTLRDLFQILSNDTSVPPGQVAAYFITQETLEDATSVDIIHSRYPKSLIILLGHDNATPFQRVDLTLSGVRVEAQLTALALLFHERHIERRRKQRRSLLMLILPALLLVTTVIVWQTTTSLFAIPAYILPSPSRIAEDFFSSTKLLFEDLSITMLESIGGFLVGAAAAFVGGVVMVHSKIVERAAYPYAIALKTVPLIAVAPLLVVWLGNGAASKIAMSALICFFPVLVNTIEGLRALPLESLALMHVLAATRWQVFIRLRLPISLPYIISGLKVSTTLSVIGALVAELSGSRNGMGHMILVASGQGNVARVFSAATLISLGSLLFFGVISAIDQLLRKDGRLWRVQ